MSVIIKGMKMPKRHLFEAFVVIGDGQIVVKDLEKNKLFAGKIKEVRTPHGRLIDADDLLRQPMNTANYPKNYVHVAPTIIEAEV